jgi:hypothetical protein
MLGKTYDLDTGALNQIAATTIVPVCFACRPARERPEAINEFISKRRLMDTCTLLHTHINDISAHLPGAATMMKYTVRLRHDDQSF